MYEYPGAFSAQAILCKPASVMDQYRRLVFQTVK